MSTLTANVMNLDISKGEMSSAESSNSVDGN